MSSEGDSVGGVNDLHGNTYGYKVIDAPVKGAKSLSIVQFNYILSF